MIVLHCMEVFGLLVSGKISRIRVIQKFLCKYLSVKHNVLYYCCILEVLNWKSIEVFASVVVFTGRSLEFGPNDMTLL